MPSSFSDPTTAGFSDSVLSSLWKEVRGPVDDRIPLGNGDMGVGYPCAGGAAALAKAPAALGDHGAVLLKTWRRE